MNYEILQYLRSSFYVYLSELPGLGLNSKIKQKLQKDGRVRDNL